MNRFSGEIRRDDPNYNVDIQAIAQSLMYGRAVFIRFAENGTAKGVFLMRLGAAGTERVQLNGNHRDFWVYPHGFGDQDGIFVAVENGKATWLPWHPEGLHPSYVTSYLDANWGWNPDSAEPLTTFLNDVAKMYGLLS